MTELLPRCVESVDPSFPDDGPYCPTHDRDLDSCREEAAEMRAALTPTMGHANWCRIGGDHIGPCDDLAPTPDPLREAVIGIAVEDNDGQMCWCQDASWDEYRDGQHSQGCREIRAALDSKGGDRG